MEKNLLNIPKNMNAIEIKEFGKAENLKLCIRPTPKIRNKQILIKVSFAGVNRPDIFKDKVITKFLKMHQTYLV